MGQYDFQGQIPIAGVAQLYADRPVKEAAIQAQQNQQLMQGLQQFGQGVQSLVDRRQKMAAALAGAQIYGQTPEGQQVLGTNTVATSPTGQAVTRNQTAAFDPSTGTVTPNTSPVTTQSVASSMFGQAPGELINNINAQATNRRLADEAQQKIDLERKALPMKLQIQQSIANMLNTSRMAEIGQQNTSSMRTQNDALSARNGELLKQFPGYAGTFAQGILPPNSNAKLKAAFDEYNQNQRTIKLNNDRLFGQSTIGPGTHLSTAQLLAIAQSAQ